MRRKSSSRAWLSLSARALASSQRSRAPQGVLLDGVRVDLYSTASQHTAPGTSFNNQRR
jgi:hypothetical protein